MTVTACVSAHVHPHDCRVSCSLPLTRHKVGIHCRFAMPTKDTVMLKIWGRKNSSNVRKALWIAHELGLDFESVEAGGAFGVVDEPRFRALNPNGLVPLLEDGDTVLWESNAIVRYLCAAYGTEQGWFPSDPAARAQADKWMDWTTSTLAAPIRPMFWGLLRTPPAERDEAAIEASRQRCGELLAMVDETLSRQPYLSGTRIGMGDIPLGCFIYAWFELPIQRPALPHLEAWYQRLKARPAYQLGVMSPLT